MRSASSEYNLRPRTAGADPSASAQFHPCRPACPRCKSGLVRIRRRLVDRIVSAIFPVRRYRCLAFFCCWEGTLPYKRSVRDRPKAAKTGAPGAVSAGTIASDGPPQIGHFDTTAPI